MSRDRPLIAVADGEALLDAIAAAIARADETRNPPARSVNSTWTLGLTSILRVYLRQTCGAGDWTKVQWKCVVSVGTLSTVGTRSGGDPYAFQGPWAIGPIAYCPLTMENIRL
jgi:hypothetical protein